jgi:hypothetical protein
MKRAPFLGAVGALLLAGCGGHNVMSSPIPGVPSSSKTGPSPQKFQWVPAIADPIPDTVLLRPIIGEVRRFDGAAAPTNWMLTQGQRLSAAENQQLFSILGNGVGGDAKGGFTLPNPGVGMIIAVAGIFPTSPASLATAGRHTSLQASLGPGAQPRTPRAAKPPSTQALAERNLALSAPRVGNSRPARVTPEQAVSYRAAFQDARSAAVDALNPSNRARLESVVQAAVVGQIDVYGAIVQMTSALSGSEANALLDVNDRMTRPFSNNWTPGSRENAQIDAGHFLISVAITREQSRTIFQRERHQLGL